MSQPRIKRKYLPFTVSTSSGSSQIMTSQNDWKLVMSSVSACAVRWEPNIGVSSIDVCGNRATE
jgi:hypothetical protein